MDIRIEPYQTAFCEDVVGLSLRAWEPVFDSLRTEMSPEVYQHFYPQEWRVAQEAAVRAALGAEDMHSWVATLDGKIAGFTALRLHPDDQMGEIYMIATDPAAQRRGVAAALTEFAFNWMNQQGAGLAMVETGADPGHAPARATYERMGFELLLAARYFKKL